MRKPFLYLLYCWIALPQLMAQPTVFQQSNGKRTATYAELMRWYQDFDRKHRQAQMMPYGETDAGEPLHILLWDPSRSFNPMLWQQQQRLVVLVNNGIHPGEPDGIDASMLLLQDLASGKYVLPDRVSLVFIPVYNVGGHQNRNSFSRANQDGPESYGFRGNSRNLDLNRDFVKTDSKEALSFNRLFTWLDPDIFIDTHVSDGADYQHTMTLITTQYEKLGFALGNWLKLVYEPALFAAMEKRSEIMCPYVDFESEEPDAGMQMFFDPPRYSTGYASLFQTLAFMPETHMLKPYPQRVQATQLLLEEMIRLGGQYRTTIKAKRKESREALLQTKQLPIRWKVDSTQSTRIRFLGYEKDTIISAATQLPQYRFNRNKPFDKQVRYWNTRKPAEERTVPNVYLLPKGWHNIRERLQANGVYMERIQRDTMIRVEQYRITNYNTYNRAYEMHYKHYQVQLQRDTVNMLFQPGDWMISTQQAARRYLFEALEPDTEDSFFAWNLFDGILQQKEGYSAYRWDSLAADWLKKNPTLQRELDAKRASDPAFAKNAAAQLDWIYKRSPYYESSHLRYPVYRSIAP